jgi:Cyclin, C-terminal domain
MIFYYSELALMQHFLIEVCPSLIAASSVYTARLTLKKTPLWTAALQHCTRYSEPHLLYVTSPFRLIISLFLPKQKCILSNIIPFYFITAVFSQFFVAPERG